VNAKDLTAVSTPVFDVHPYPYVLGAEVHGLDLGQPIDDGTIKALYAEWVKYKVLVFVGQDISDAQQVDFTRRLGPLEQFPLGSVRDRAHKEVFRVANVGLDGKKLPVDDATWRYIKVTQSWHIDSSYRAVPSKGSLLRAVEVTRQGGETWFADLEKAYAGLPADLKRRIEGRKAVHDFEISRRRVGNLTPLTPAEKAAVPPMEHLFVRIHPDTGRRSLFLSPGHTSHIAGMSEEEGKALLDELVEFATQDEYVYRHRWWPGDAVLWDNRSVMHYAQPFDERVLRRVMHRTTLVGDGPVSAG